MSGHPAQVMDPQSAMEPPVPARSAEDKAYAARRLKPHYRNSQLALDKYGKPEALTPMPAKKSRPTKWQFGIRSRNAPGEAMLAIYRALHAMGADWEVPAIRKPGRHRSRSRSRSSSGSRSDEREDWSDGEGDVDKHHNSPRSTRSSLRVRNSDDGHMEMGRGRKRDGFSKRNDWGYQVPEDPWVIHARFRKKGMFPPGTTNPSSARSSVVDLTATTERGMDATGSASSSNQPSREGSLAALSSHEDLTATTEKLKSKYVKPEDSVHVYVTIQLYSIERDTFLVDFKSSGYENLERKFHREMKQQGHQVYGTPTDSQSHHAGEGWRTISPSEQVETGAEQELRDVEEFVPQGRAQAEKRATSPFPFLDVASGLIIQLAEGGGG